jgi:hypothetical protein
MKAFVAAALLALLASAKSLAAFEHFVYWVARPENLSTATEVTPQVWVSGDEWAEQKYRRYPLALWGEKGIRPLSWALGIAARNADAEAYAADWIATARRGYPGIAVDEFGSEDPAVNRAMAEALRRTRRELSDTFIAAWHAGPLTAELAEAYRDAADIVLVECYARTLDAFVAQARTKLGQARSLGIAGKCALSLGVNDTRPLASGAASQARDLDTVRSQLEWIRANAADTAGVGFFAPFASRALVDGIDRTVRELFLQPAAPI